MHKSSFNNFLSDGKIADAGRKTYNNLQLEYGFVTNRTLDPRGFEIPAKSPVGMFENLFIPNDMGLVIEKIKEYNEGN